MNPISRLAQIQQAKKEKEPEYLLLSERGMPRRREFIMQVTSAAGRTLRYTICYTLCDVLCYALCAMLHAMLHGMLCDMLCYTLCYTLCYMVCYVTCYATRYATRYAMRRAMLHAMRYAMLEIQDDPTMPRLCVVKVKLYYIKYWGNKWWPMLQKQPNRCNFVFIVVHDFRNWYILHCIIL